MRRQRRQQQEAELDVTSFMNLMIVLVPVLLMNMVISQMAVLDLRLPLGEQNSAISSEEVTFEVVIRQTGFELARSYQNNTETLLVLPKTQGEYAHSELSLALQDIKKNPEFAEKTDISLLSEPEIDYQTIVQVMDTVRVYPAVVAASLVNAVLFPDISLGEAPEVTP